MTSNLTIWCVTHEGFSGGSLLPELGAEILKEPHGEDMFLYTKALKLECHECLGPANFLNLCKVANSRKKKLDGTFKNYISTKEGLSRLTDYEVEREKGMSGANPRRHQKRLWSNR